MLNRRIFLKGAAVTMFGVGAAPGWLARAAGAAQGAGRRKKILVAVFQRGAADGLNMVVPHGEERYYQMRPAIAVPRPGRGEDAAIDLDGHFGLHPALRGLKPVYEAGRLAIVEAVGSPDPTRSHFDAQDYMESGTPGTKTEASGWLNRALKVEAEKPSPIRAVSIGAQLPLTLKGANAAVALAGLKEFRVADGRAEGVFEQMYGEAADSAMRGTGRETFEAMKMVEAIEKEADVPRNGAQYPNGRLGQSLRRIARLIQAEAGLEVAFADVGGWDHHVNECGAKASEGQLAASLGQFGDALAAFQADLGERMDDVVVVTMSEFGRTARENGDRGTDHGHANVMFVMGGGVRGGKIYGEWPGLSEERLYEGRDLALTTDFRDVLGEVVVKHLGNEDLWTVFPGYGRPRFPGLLG